MGEKERGKSQQSAPALLSWVQRYNGPKSSRPHCATHPAGADLDPVQTVARGELERRLWLGICVDPPHRL